MNKVIKLPKGKMNFEWVRCKVGYAEGARKPARRKAKTVVFNPVRVILRGAA